MKERVHQEESSPIREGDIIHVSQMGRLHPNLLLNPVVTVTTPVEIHAKPDEKGVEYSVLIDHPVRQNDLVAMLQRFSELPYSMDMTYAAWTSGEDEFGGGERPHLQLLAKLLEAPDDASFIENITRRILSHGEAWRDCIDRQGFAQSLVDQINDGATNPKLFDTANRVIDVMRAHPDLWTNQPDREQSATNKRLISRFAKLDPGARGRVLEYEMQEFEEKDKEKKERIRQSNGIRFETRYNNEDWYFVGMQGDVRVHEDQVLVSLNENKALIKVTSEGFNIYPYSPFLLPTLTWRKDANGRRNWVVPSRFHTDKMVIQPKFHPHVHHVYPIDTRHLSNPLTGFLLLQYALGFPREEHLPPEAAPEFATRFRKGEILQSDFIKNAEQLVS